MTRIGPGMHRAVAYVARSGGEVHGIGEIIRSIGTDPDGIRRGRDIIERCVAKGLLTRTGNRLTLTDAGRGLVNVDGKEVR